MHLVLGVYDGPILKEEAEETTLEECAAAWEDARPSAECWCRTTCWPKFGTDIHILCLDFCTVFGTNSGEKVHIWFLDFCTVLGISLAQDVHILCMDAKTTYCTFWHSIIARTFLWRMIDPRKRIMLHNKLQLHYANSFSGILLLARNCVEWQGSWDIMELHIHGLHAKYFWGTNFSQKGTQNSRWLHKILWEYCNVFVKNMFGFLHSFLCISGAKKSSWRHF